MSLPNEPPPPIRVTAVAVSLVSAQGSRGLSSGRLCIGCNQYKLICDQGTLCQDFPDATLSPNDRITLHYRTSQWPLARKTVQLDIRPLFTTFSTGQTQDLSVVQNGIRVAFTGNPDTRVPEPGSPAAHSDGTLLPTTETIFDDCPQFRILVIGKSGVGKSSLINVAFGIEAAHTSDLVRGKADIETELKSTVNERFVLHDSIGFECGENGNYKVVKDFIRKRQTGPLKDRLHAIWFCVAIPRAGERLLEVASEDFFQTKKTTLGTVPIIVVYTKLDLAVNQFIMQSHGEQSEQRAHSQTKSNVGKLHEEINRLSGETLPHTAISTEKKYEHTIKNLVKLTQDKVAGVTLIAAQRVDPSLKIKGTIDVGTQRYWKVLMASPHFRGHTIWDCLSVIHADIVAVWNFNDPICHLLDVNFKKLVVGMVEKMETGGPLSNPNKFLALGGSSLIAIIPALLATIANPAAPIVLPIVAGTVAAVWLFKVYQNVPKVQQIFIAYIVHLTHILEALFILTFRHHKKLTRRIIKAAYMTYHNSDLMRQVHAKIQNHRSVNSGDTPLQMIESLINPEQSNAGFKDYYAEINKLDLAKYSLDQDEEWE